MGVEPVTTTVYLGFVVAGALALYLSECERQRKRDENIRREARKREKEERRRERESEKQAQREEEREIREWEKEARRRKREEQALREDEREKREWEKRKRQERENDQIRRENALSQPFSYGLVGNRNCMCELCEPEFQRFEGEILFGSNDRYNPELNRNCRCALCDPEQARPRIENSHYNSQFQSALNPFDRPKNSITVTITSPQTRQDKNPNVKTQGSDNRPSSSNSQGATTSKTSGNEQKTNSAQKSSSSGSQQPQRNDNNNNNNNNKNKVQDYGKLNDFIKKLKTVLDRCNASAELREKILSFFTIFEKHEENFLRMLEDFRIQNIAIEDILSIVVRLFQSDYFSKDVAYEKFIALMEFIVKYIKDELMFEIAKDSLNGNKTPCDSQRAKCMKKVLQRNNILTEITDLFEVIRKEIVADNTNQPLEPDFSGIFTKIYHYFKHKDFRSKKLTVKEYFDWIRKLLILLKDLNPEYAELTDVSHTRRQIVFEVYSTVFRGRFRIVVRAYGPNLKICTFFLKERYDKKAKDGEKYVDGKKKP